MATDARRVADPEVQAVLRYFRDSWDVEVDGMWAAHLERDARLAAIPDDDPIEIWGRHVRTAEVRIVGILLGELRKAIGYPVDLGLEAG